MGIDLAAGDMRKQNKRKKGRGVEKKLGRIGEESEIEKLEREGKRRERGRTIPPLNRQSNNIFWSLLKRAGRPQW